MSSSRQLLIAGIAAVALVGCQKDGPAASSTEQGATTDAVKTAAAPTAAEETVGQPTAARVAEHSANQGAKTAQAAADVESECGGAKLAEHEGAGCGDMAQAGGGCNQWDGEASEVSKRAVPSDAVWTSWSVTGMTCGGCERRIIANVGKLDGVVAVEADAELGRVRVALAANAPTSASDAQASIAALGYRIQ